MRHSKSSAMLLTALAAAVFTTSCSKDIEANSLSAKSQERNDTTITINIGANGFNTTIEPLTRAATSLTDVSSINRIDLWLTSGEDVVEVHQTISDASYGSPSVTIDKRKAYQLVVVAHKGSAPATLSDGIMSFPDEKLTDTFLYSDTFTTISGTTIQLQRIVAMFKLWMTDPLPAADTRFTVTISGTNNRWNTATASSTNQADRTITFNSPIQSADGSTKLNIYILPSNLTDESTATVRCQAFTADGTPIKEHTFTDAPIRAGYVTTYKGMFFTEQSFSFAMTADNAWQEYDPVDF